MERNQRLLNRYALDEEDTIYVLELSYGKDSLACLGAIEKLGLPLHKTSDFKAIRAGSFEEEMKTLNMYFNYEPIPYKDIKSGKGEYTTDFQKMLLANARRTDESLADINVRLRGTTACFTDKIVWDDDVLQTITAGGKIFRGGGEQEKISIEDIISATTFPQDYDFGNEHPRYICGMSVPPVMIKRIVQRLIESKIFGRKGD